MSAKGELRRLRELEWRELDIKEAGSWPWSLQFICCVLLLCLTFAGMHWYLAAPAAEELEQVRAEESRLLRDYRSKAAQAANLEVMRSEMENLESRMRTLQQMLPTGAEIPALIDDISGTAIDNQLAIDFIRLRAPVEREHYVERPFDIQVQGDYHRLAAFLAGVAGLPRIVTLHDMTLAPEGDNGQNLRLSLLARTYSYRQDEEAP
ncbi:type 4a pilus biogenesis protein PilO [Halomonas urumqiensis]|uniref:Pilus assembly protein PilO n=1 Tax=Halomonas urumqiensis TaxID=1684789 RepID=A0A2N7UIL1_9GAMM|nr:type 4a pilus biogenesis protein PilO [Halomonas urumqiensis]PMR80287.1 pilus assembly protein PilO [Halomonas urumqiensis]PTB01610.1 pilus assembly protein PilO [Halomonas urumqiensis]GHE22299.1 type 4 fimbrial biogenesis protein PilO [Halomonas urumqiensis]